MCEPSAHSTRTAASLPPGSAGPAESAEGPRRARAVRWVTALRVGTSTRRWASGMLGSCGRLGPWMSLWGAVRGGEETGSRAPGAGNTGRRTRGQGRRGLRSSCTEQGAGSGGGAGTRKSARARQELAALQNVKRTDSNFLSQKGSGSVCLHQNT